MHAQTMGTAVLGDTVVSNAVHMQVNYFLFLERVQQPWSCFMSGNGGYVDNEGYADGFGWDPYIGPDAVLKAASPAYHCQLSMYLSGDMESSYAAALNGCATFEAVSVVGNGYVRQDLRTERAEVLGTGPPTWITVSSGYSTSTHSELTWGPQLEFIDAVRDSTDPKPSLAMSFCASATAARYANLKSARPDWNVFDLRQGLRQASTFYDPKGGGWRENGGYGFPLVSNVIGNNFIPAVVPLNKAELDAAPPIQPVVLPKSGPAGPLLMFKWYNFRQSAFDHTRIKIGSLMYDMPATNSNFLLDVASSWPLPSTTAQFFTVLTSGKTSPNELYTQVPIPPALAQPQFNSDSDFQFNIYAKPCTSAANNPVQVFASSDLISWSFLQQFCLPDGTGTFHDTSISNLNCRLYRVVQGNLHSQTFGFTRVIVPAASSNLIANQLEWRDYSLPAVFSASTIPSPITLTKADQTSVRFKPMQNSWSDPTAKLNLGEAAWFNNPGSSDCIIRFVGDVREGRFINPVTATNSIVSFMLPIPLTSYPQYSSTRDYSDPLGPGATLQHWEGNKFVTYYHDLWNWIPQTPPLRPGEGFSLSPGFTIPANNPVPWGVAFSAYSAPFTRINELLITSFKFVGGRVLLSFSTLSGQLYRLEYTDDPMLNSWQIGEDNMVGTGDPYWVSFSAASPARFFRIRQL